MLEGVAVPDLLEGVAVTDLLYNSTLLCSCSRCNYLTYLNMMIMMKIIVKQNIYIITTVSDSDDDDVANLLLLHISSPVNLPHTMYCTVRFIICNRY